MFKKLIIKLAIIFIIIYYPNLALADTNLCGTETHDCDCGATINIYPCCDNNFDDCSDCGRANECADDGCDGNCTWWAWEMACCNWGVSLPWENHANQWATEAGNAGYLVNNTPAVYTIAVSETGIHVAWVKEVRNSGQAIFVSEMRCICNKVYKYCSNPGDPNNSVREKQHEISGGLNQFIYPPLIRAQGHFISPQGTDYGNDPIFILQNGKYYHITNADVFNMMQHPDLPRWSWSRVKDVSADRLYEIFNDQGYIEGPEFIKTDSTSNDLLIRQVNEYPVHKVYEGGLVDVSYTDCQATNCWANIIDVTEDIINLLSGPDINGDGQVNIVDLTLYVVAYRNEEMIADVNGDSQVNIVDLTLYVLAYRAAQ